MKKLLSIIIVVLSGTLLQAQITQEQANTIVLQYIQNEIAPPYLLYGNINTPSEEGMVITTLSEEIVRVKYACWAYYLNEDPETTVPSQHRYLFVKEDNGSLLEIITTNDLGLTDLSEWEIVSPLSVIEREKGSLTVYPNPTTGELRITSDELRIENVEVFDIYGRKLIEQKAEGRKQKALDISELQPGVYFIKIQTDNEITTKKIVKR